MQVDPMKFPTRLQGTQNHHLYMHVHEDINEFRLYVAIIFRISLSLLAVNSLVLSILNVAMLICSPCRSEYGVQM